MTAAKPSRSKIKRFRSATFLSSSNAINPPVGSLIILLTFNPAIVPASFVAYRCESLKYAGIVITEFLTSLPRYDSAVYLILKKKIYEISSVKNR